MVAVVLYHGVDSGEKWHRALSATDREYILSRRRFEEHMEYLARHDVPVTSLGKRQAEERHSRGHGRLPVILTFDDGDLSCYTTTAPILEQFGFRGEFFVVSQWVGQPGFVTRAQLQELAERGHRIHSHSRTHPVLTALDTAAIDEEVGVSKLEVEAMIDAPVEYFSIPNGAYDERVVDAARRAGYAGVLNSAEGYNDGRRSPFVLRRFTVRSYTTAQQMASVSVWPRCTAARLTLKRGAISTVKRLLGGRYARLRQTVVSRKMHARDGKP
jgi:peptidoglycan/xylan/chitin deacetylase (PgdA/CDA1 family)